MAKMVKCPCFGLFDLEKLYYSEELDSTEQQFLKNINKETKIGDYGMFLRITMEL